MYWGEVKVKRHSVMKREVKREQSKNFPSSLNSFLYVPFSSFLVVFFLLFSSFRKVFLPTIAFLVNNISSFCSYCLVWESWTWLTFFPSLYPFSHPSLLAVSSKACLFHFLPSSLSLCLSFLIHLSNCSYNRCNSILVRFFLCQVTRCKWRAAWWAGDAAFCCCSHVSLSLSLFLFISEPLPLNLYFFFFSYQRRYNKFLGGDSSFSKMSCQRKIIDERDQKQVVKKIDVIHLQ